MTPSDRPERPAPLDVTSEESKAAWRHYLTACARADNPAFQASPDIRAILARQAHEH